MYPSYVLKCKAEKFSSEKGQLIKSDIDIILRFQ